MAGWVFDTFAILHLLMETGTVFQKGHQEFCWVLFNGLLIDTPSS